MAEATRNEGEVQATGEVRASPLRAHDSAKVQAKMERIAESGGVGHLDSWVTARLEEGGRFVVSVGGRAVYGDRTASQTLEVTKNLSDLKAALTAVLTANQERIKRATTRAAAGAMMVAAANGEPGFTDEEDEG